MARYDRAGRARRRMVDLNYLLARQQTERTRAEAAKSEAARRIHEQLANEYERMIEDATAGRVTFARTGIEQR